MAGSEQDPGLALRANIVLILADGMRVADVAAELSVLVKPGEFEVHVVLVVQELPPGVPRPHAVGDGLATPSAVRSKRAAARSPPSSGVPRASTSQTPSRQPSTTPPAPKRSVPRRSGGSSRAWRHPRLTASAAMPSPSTTARSPGTARCRAALRPRGRRTPPTERHGPPRWWHCSRAPRAVPAQTRSWGP